MGRFGRAALRPIYELIAQGGGNLPRDLPAITPRRILSHDREGRSEPVRIYSDAAGGGNLASIAFLPQDSQELPVLLQGTADGELNAIAAPADPIYISELFATVATTFQLRAANREEGCLLRG